MIPIENVPIDLSDRLGVVVPWFNGTHLVHPFMKAVGEQDYPGEIRCYFVDSSPNDRTFDLLSDYDATVVRLDPKDFDHGSARNTGAQLAMNDGCEILVFMTQDAILHRASSLRSLVSYFEESKVGLVSGRQIPQESAHPLEAFWRQQRYPAEPWSNQRHFVSNTYCAIRSSVFVECGQFDSPTIFGEDQAFADIVGAKGYDARYAPDSAVLHSHELTIRGSVKRYFDMGAQRARKAPTQKTTAQPRPLDVLRQEFWSLAKGSSTTLLASWLFHTSLRSAGYMVGRASPKIPHGIARRFSTSKQLYDRFVRSPKATK